MMKTMKVMILCVVGLCSLPALAADDSAFAGELLSLQREFDSASFGGLDESSREAAFEALVEHAADFSARYSDRVEAVAWNGIVLSAYAGEAGAFGAMKIAKAARKALHEAESMAPGALDGGLYASLGALYAKVPGGIIGFGDDELAADYFEKAIEADPDNMDSNFFYGEFLLEQKRYDDAIAVLGRGLGAPTVDERPLFDAGRRQAMRDLIESAREHIGVTAAK